MGTCRPVILGSCLHQYGTPTSPHTQSETQTHTQTQTKTETSSHSAAIFAQGRIRGVEAPPFGNPLLGRGGAAHSLAPEMGDDIVPFAGQGYLLGGGRVEEPQPPPAPRPRPMCPERQWGDAVEVTDSPPDNNTLDADEPFWDQLLPRHDEDRNEEMRMELRVEEMLSICDRLRNVAAISIAELSEMPPASIFACAKSDLDGLVKRAENAATSIENKVQAHISEHTRTGHHNTVLIWRLVEARELVIHIETLLEQVQKQASKLIARTTDAATDEDDHIPLETLARKKRQSVDEESDHDAGGFSTGGSGGQAVADTRPALRRCTGLASASRRAAPASAMPETTEKENEKKDAAKKRPRH